MQEVGAGLLRGNGHTGSAGVIADLANLGKRRGVLKMVEVTRFAALTLDTQTVQKAGFRLDQGGLKLLRQFQGSPIQVIMSSVVLREIASHMEDATRTLRTTLKGVGKDVDRLLPQLRGIIDSDELDKIDPGKVARRQLSNFLSLTGAEKVETTWANLPDIERRYFGTLPPFAGSNNKKHEFPDAMALSSLEGWGKSKNKRILAVSEDKGWVAYDSEYIKVVPDIKTALGILQEDPEHRAHLFVRKHLQELPFRKLYQHAEDFSKLLEEAFSRIEFSVHLESDMAADPEYPEVDLRAYTVGDDFTIVKIDDDDIVADVDASLVADVSVNVAFSVHDGIDDDDVPMGDAYVVRKVALDDTRLLITFSGDFQTDDWAVTEVEVSAISDTIDLGYVAPSWREQEEEGLEEMEAEDE